MPRLYRLGHLRSLQCFPPVYSFIGVTPSPWLGVKGGGKVEWELWCCACLGNERRIYAGIVHCGMDKIGILVRMMRSRS
jgi:hypothetical protein